MVECARRQTSIGIEKTQETECVRVIVKLVEVTRTVLLAST